MKKVKQFIKHLFIEPIYYTAYRVLDSKDDCVFSKEHFNYKIVECNQKYWIADPFVFSYHGKIYLFCETMERRHKKAYISCKQLFPSEEELSPSLELIGHLSYPCVFNQNDKVYCIPEMTYSNSICLLECNSFPNSWRVASILKDNIFAPDSTIFKSSYGLKLFVYKKNESFFSLYLYDFDISEKKIKNEKHLIDFEPGKGRPGGNVLHYQNSDYRVVQGQKNTSESSIEFYKIDYDETNYTEHKIFEIDKNMISLDKNIPIDGIHTFNRIDNIEVVDILSHKRVDIFRPFKIIFQKLGIFGFNNYDKKKKKITKL